MGQFYDAIPTELIPWILKQEIFWVASAPLNPEGHVNVSPKGVRDSFHVISPTRVWYQDLTGSGVETISHLRENGRITLLFCAFEGPPRTVRLFGKGTFHEFGTPEYDELIPPENRRPGSRAAIVIDVYRVGTSCGYAVPYYEFRGHRQVLLKHLDACEKGPTAICKNGLKGYWAENNAHSIDGLAGLVTAAHAPQALESTAVMKQANSAEGDQVPKGPAVAAKSRIDRRRVQDWVVAFALGIAVAALYLQVADFVEISYVRRALMI